MPKQKSISNTIDKELEKEKEKQMLALYMHESEELAFPNLDVYTSLLFSLIFLLLFFKKKKNLFMPRFHNNIYFSHLYLCYTLPLSMLLSPSPPPHFSHLIVVTIISSIIDRYCCYHQ